MTKKLTCDCGFTAQGDVTETQLRDIGLLHVRQVHPKMLSEMGEQKVRAACKIEEI
jgi:predicted small metal-binding protein